MQNPDRKIKLTLSISPEILDKVKRITENQGVPLSRMVENFFLFLIERKVYCFKCGQSFSMVSTELCPKCGWGVCPECSICRCSLSDETAEAVFHMRKVYEDLVGGRLK